MAGGSLAPTRLAKERAEQYKGRVTAFVIIACIVAVIGGALFGYDIGISGVIMNDETVHQLCKQDFTQARAGADVVSPSDMMDGHIGAIRAALDADGFQHVSIMSYTAKYASSFYGPLGEASDSNPRFGDKKTYQMNPTNYREALVETREDETEGADILLVKPGLPYLDIIRLLRDNSPLPIDAYQGNTDTKRSIEKKNRKHFKYVDTGSQSLSWKHDRGRHMGRSFQNTNILRSTKCNFCSRPAQASLSDEEDTAIGAMPRYCRLGWRHGLVEEVSKARDVGVNSIMLFPKVRDALKSPTEDEAYNENGLVPRTIRLLKDKYPDLVIYTDVALGFYSSDGHDGIVREDGKTTLSMMHDERVIHLLIFLLII
ncbi:Delta-aminolevulinic acid dehydratase 1 [Abeliophyllum distichum]|uniref:Delta-aminolevulinic acid dehydratase n=1 Tax=Abeliophyllum distichum TaxID=126358 RepID=A0ABD1SUV2_9LAMI